MKSFTLIVLFCAFQTSLSYAQTEIVSDTLQDSCVLYMPNSLSGSGDSYNVCVEPKYSCPMDSYQLFIFNRWGEVMFESSESEPCWDGSYKGQALRSEVYVWLVRIITPDGEFEFRGNISILR